MKPTKIEKRNMDIIIIPITNANWLSENKLGARMTIPIINRRNGMITKWLLIFEDEYLFVIVNI